MSQQTRPLALTPIYRPTLDPIELFCVKTTTQNLQGVDHYFVHPTAMATSRYKDLFPSSTFIPMPDIYFQSQRSYNQLCYEKFFYEIFNAYTHMLITQTDAIVVTPNSLKTWCELPFDYVGGPEGNLYSYDIRTIKPFNLLPNSLHPVKLQGLNGGLSLRRINSMICALEEYPDLTKLFRTHAGGIGEDIFFSLMGRVSNTGFRVPNEIQASRFAVTCNFGEWTAYNNNLLPLGFHAWFRRKEDQEYVLGLLGISTS